jgi:hypothetical protein
MRPRVILVAALALSTVIAFGAGYALGRSSEQTVRQLAVQDAMTSKTLLAIRSDLLTLTLLREGKPAIQDLELAILVQLQGVEPSAIIPGSASDFLFPRMLQSLSEYRAKFTDTALDPSREPQVAKVLSFKR